MADGKIRAAHTKSNKANTLYNTDSYVVTLAPNTDGTGFLSGHADGSIVRWYVADDQNSRPQGKVVVHGVPPYALGKGTSINYVDKQGVERGGSQLSTIPYKLMLSTCHQRGRGVKNPQNLVNVVYECLLTN